MPTVSCPCSRHRRRLIWGYHARWSFQHAIGYSERQTLRRAHHRNGRLHLEMQPPSAPGGDWSMTTLYTFTDGQVPTGNTHSGTERRRLSPHRRRARPAIQRHGIRDHDELAKSGRTSLALCYAGGALKLECVGVAACAGRVKRTTRPGTGPRPGLIVQVGRSRLALRKQPRGNHLRGGIAFRYDKKVSRVQLSAPVLPLRVFAVRPGVRSLLFCRSTPDLKYGPVRSK